MVKVTKIFSTGTLFEVRLIQDSV